MGRAGAVVDDRWCRVAQCLTHSGGVEQVDALPADAGHHPRGVATRPVPRHRRHTVVCELIDEMAASEPGGSGDKRWSRHGDQRGTPFSPPLNGEKLPSPASVNDRKNRLSAGTRYDGSPAKL